MQKKQIMKINSFENIIEIGEELSHYFLIHDEALRWINSIGGGIKDWISNNNKQCWEVVRYVTEKRGIIGTLQHNGEIKLTRKVFAEVVLKFCPLAFNENETVSALKTSMEHYQFIDELKNRKIALEQSQVNKHIKDVETILDGQQTEINHETESLALSDLFYNFLMKEIGGTQQKFPYSRVCVRQQYMNVTPDLSVETYKSQALLEQHEPSHIEAYEFIDEKLTLNKLYELIGKYNNEKITKLFIVSTFGLTNDVRSKAKENDIGYVLINPKKVITSDVYILPRSIEDYERKHHDLMVLMGESRMDYPILIEDGNLLTSSLADVLLKNDVTIDSQNHLYVPYLSKEEIEQKANSYIEDLTNEHLTLLKSNTTNVKDLSVDPFFLADKNGLTYEIKELPEKQLGRLELAKKHVTLNSIMASIWNRFRYTMAHEFAHYVLHLPLFEKAGVESFGETAYTLAITNDSNKRVEYQANYFASCLLMPNEIVIRLYALYHKKYVQDIFGGDLRALYYAPLQPETYNSYNNVVGRMAKVLGVSKKAMEIKLESLNLLIQDHPFNKKNSSFNRSIDNIWNGIIDKNTY